MNYELAKQLKDAGFPQNCQWAFAISPWYKEKKPRPQLMSLTENNNGYANLLSSGYEVVASPTLEELIEACGEDFWELVKSRMLPNGTWIAVQYKLGGEVRATGSTPTEAVAKLWIALNTKTV